MASPALVAETAAPLGRMLESYSRCLALEQDFLAETPAETRAEELDLDRLESFLSARADLLAEAEHSFLALGLPGPASEDPDRQALVRQVVSVLEEMTGLEKDLSAFLSERLDRLGETLAWLRRVQPVFQRYSCLGGRLGPNLVTRHE